MPSLVAPTVGPTGCPTEMRFTAQQLPTGQAATIAMCARPPRTAPARSAAPRSRARASADRARASRRSFTYQQLDQANNMALRARAQDLQKKIGAEALPHLNPSAGKETLITFIIDVQVSMMASGLGMRVTPQFFGAPTDFADDDDEGYFGGDGYLARKDKEVASREYNVAMENVQPNHRGLSREDHVQVNLEEAHRTCTPCMYAHVHPLMCMACAWHVQVNLEEAHQGFQRSKMRNAGSISLG